MIERNVDHLTRQLDIIPMNVLDTPITIIGCGAIGSFLALSLAKMGVTQLEVFDHDTVSIENMSNQGYRFKDIGKPKALALSDIIWDFTNTGKKDHVGIKFSVKKFEPKDMEQRQGIVVCAVDSMEARRMIFESTNTFHNVGYVIDPRMSAEFYTQYVYSPGLIADCEMYKKSLFDDKDAVPTPCTAKSTVYTATLGAGFVVKTIKNMLLGQAYPRVAHWDIAQSGDSMQMYASK